MKMTFLFINRNRCRLGRDLNSLHGSHLRQCLSLTHQRSFVKTPTISTLFHNRSQGNMKRKFHDDPTCRKSTKNVLIRVEIELAFLDFRITFRE